MSTSSSCHKTGTKGQTQLDLLNFNHILNKAILPKFGGGNASRVEEGRESRGNFEALERHHYQVRRVGHD